MKFRRRIGKFEVVADCAPDLKRQATSLLNSIAANHEHGPAIHDGTTIQFGWSLLTLAGPGNELQVCEPDFSGDPLRQNLPQVDHTLTVLTEQVTLLKWLQVEGIEARFQDWLLIAKGCLDAERIYLERTERKREGDSGWYIGPVDGAKGAAKELEVLYIYQIFQKRRTLMQALALPHGSLVVFRGNVIEAVYDKNGRRLDHTGKPA